MRTSPGNVRGVERLPTRPARESVLKPTSTLGVGRGAFAEGLSGTPRSLRSAAQRPPPLRKLHAEHGPSGRRSTTGTTQRSRVPPPTWRKAEEVRGQGRKRACRTVPASPTVTKPVADPFIPIELQMPIQAPTYHHSPLHSARHSALRQFRCSQSLPRTVSGL
jgi:hypothetical protein